MFCLHLNVIHMCTTEIIILKFIQIELVVNTVALYKIITFILWFINFLLITYYYPKSIVVPILFPKVNTTKLYNFHYTHMIRLIIYIPLFINLLSI